MCRFLVGMIMEYPFVFALGRGMHLAPSSWNGFWAVAIENMRQVLAAVGEGKIQGSA